MAGLRTDVELGYEDALASVDRIGSGLDDVVARFSDGLATAIDAASSSTIAPQVDTTALEEGLASALASVEGVVVPVEADTAPAESDVADLEAGLATEQLTLSLGADVGPAEGEVADLVSVVDGETAAITVEAETSDAQSAVDDLTSSVDGLGTSASDVASGGVNALGLSSNQLAGAAGLAVGEVGGLREASSLLGERTAAATGGVLGLGIGVGALYKAGLDATSAEERYNQVLGDTAQRVEAVRVGDLTTDLFALTHEMGSTDAATRNAAATIFQFSLNAGSSREGAAQFTDQLFALAARAVALKPSLGDVSDVAASMEVGLGRARSAAQQYGIAISQDEINTRAMNDTQKTSASELTAYEKSVAGAEIAVERYGGTLKGTVAEGAQNAAIAERRLTAEFEDNLAALGKPLVAPALETIKAAIPVATQLGSALSQVASVAIPVVTFALDELRPLIGPIVEGFIAMKVAALAATAVSTLAGGLEVLSGFLPVAGAAVESFAGEVAGASIAIESAAGPIGLIVAGAGLAAGALGLFGDSTDSTRQKVDDFATSLENANGKLDESATKSARALFEERNQGDDLRRTGLQLNDVLAATSKAGADQRSVLEDLERVTTRVSQANGNNTASYELTGHSLAELHQQQAQYVARLRETNPALADVAAAALKDNAANAGFIGTLRDLAQTHADVTRKLKDRAAAGDADAQISKEQADASKKEADARKAATTAIDAYKQSLDDLISPQLDVTDAQLRLAESSDKVAAAYAQQVDESHPLNVVLQGQQAALIDNTKAAESLAESTYKQVYATQGQSAATYAANTVMLQFAGSLRDQLVNSYGLSTDAADAMLQKLGLFQYVAPPANDALGAIGGALAKLGIDGNSSAADVDAAMKRIKESAQTNSAGAASAVEDNGGRLAGAAGQAGSDASGGFAAGISGMPGTASNTVLDSTNAAALAGANAHNVGYGIGASLSAGIGDGIIANDGYVTAQAEQVISDAETAARQKAQSSSPSRLFALIGEDLAAGVAVGLEAGTPGIATAARGSVDAAAVEVAGGRLVPTLPRAAVFPTAQAPAAGGAPAGTTPRGAGPGVHAGHSVVVHNHLHVRADASTPDSVVKKQAGEYADQVGAATVRAVIGAL